MGLVAGTITKQYLIAYRNELEYKTSLIRQAKMGLSESATELLTAGQNYDKESPVLKQLEARRERLNLLEKKLDMQLAEYEEKLKMIDRNLEAADKMIESSIK